MQNEIWGAALITLLLASPALAQQALHCDGLDPAKPGHATRAYECVSKLSNDLAEALARLEALEADTHPEPEIPRIPKDAVVAFDTPDTCPEGWSHFAEGQSRAIMGAGSGAGFTTGMAVDEGRNPLTEYKYRQHGGRELVTLTKEQMPHHSHSFSGTSVESGGWGGQGVRPVAVGGSQLAGLFTPEGQIAPAGGNLAHPNMPPYIALYFCKKD